MAEAPEVRLFQNGTEMALGPGLNGTEVQESSVLCRVEAKAPATVLFDDEPVPCVSSDGGKTLYFQLDLTNEVGFHRVSVRVGPESAHFDFRTRTAKATWTEVQGMARVVAKNSFAFRHQFVYSLPNGQRRAVRLPEVEVGWFRDRVDVIRTLVERVDARPGLESRPRTRVSHEARNVSIPLTNRLLRERPSLVESSPSGPLVIGAEAFWPAAVVVTERTHEPARLEHSQLAHFLSQAALRLNALADDVPKGVKPAVREWSRAIAHARSCSVVRKWDKPNARLAWTVMPTQLQRTDERYRRLRAIHSEYLQDVDVANPSMAAVRANIKDAWEIFQGFVAHSIGKALGLSYVSKCGDLRDRASGGFSMYSDRYELFYDVNPPNAVLSSWRSTSARPAIERPDIVVFDREANKVAVLDAKFKVEKDGVRATSEDIFEMQGYLNSYGITKGAIVFPGANATPVPILGDGMSIVEMPLRASFFEDPTFMPEKYIAGTLGLLWSERQNQ